ncbi:MmcQ/YjbR family DNA-binding protein [Holzapfeliella sp. JNUCC 80]
MDIRKNQLGLSEEEIITILNVKVEKELIGNFRKEKNIFPAYHMNKENWVSINLNSNISFLNIKKLIDTSFELTS